MKRPTNSYRQPLIDLTAEVPGVEPPHSARVPRPPRHAAGCWCEECWQTGLETAEYLQKKRLFDANGF